LEGLVHTPELAPENLPPLKKCTPIFGSGYGPGQYNKFPLQRRTQELAPGFFIEALRVPTDDDNPGYIDLPFWGRFPVIVGDNYEVSENADEQGQCAVSIPFRRAGVSITERLEKKSSPGARPKKAAANLEAVAIDDFEASLTADKPDNATLASCFGWIKNSLLAILGRIQGARNILNSITGEILGITSLINQGIRTPRELAQALFNAGASIAGGIQEIKNSIAMYGRESNTASPSSKPSLPLPDNEKNILILFL
jgi:hypothetical protein